MRTATTFTLLVACGRPTAESGDAVAPRRTREAKPASAEVNVKRPITRDMLVEMFDNMESQGWDLSKPMVWGYFFVDDDRSRLEAPPPARSKGLRIREVSPARGAWRSSDASMHTVETLDARNERFCGLVAYDGMDVGPIELDPEMKEQDDARH
jgi:hypothetical protein